MQKSQRKIRALFTVAVALTAGLSSVGCGLRGGDGGTAGQNALTHSTPEHGHDTPHGGVVVTVGASHHAEAVWEPATGRLEIFVLGADETAAFPIPVQNLTATLQLDEQREQALTLPARALPGEAAGSFASHFETVVPPAADGETKVSATFPSLTVALPLGGKEHRVRFTRLLAAARGIQPVENPGHEEHMAAAVPTAREKALFFTPGGLYTRADIAANGDSIPAQRFSGVMARHNQFPAKGARLCPISGTQANPKFSWFIGGKRYVFCCPPCVEEFVEQAKKRPKTIRPPHDYVKKD